MSILCKQHLAPSHPLTFTPPLPPPTTTPLTRFNPTHRASFVGFNLRLSTVGFNSYLTSRHVFTIICFIAKLKKVVALWVIMPYKSCV